MISPQDVKEEDLIVAAIGVAVSSKNKTMFYCLIAHAAGRSEQTFLRLRNDGFEESKSNKVGFILVERILHDARMERV